MHPCEQACSMRGGRCRRGAMSESSIGAATDFAVENGREIGCVGMTIPTCFHDERGAQTWIEGRFCESKAGGDARRCANKPKPTKGYGEVPLGTRLGDPLHKVPSEGLTGVVAEITDSRTSIRSAREKRCCSWIYAAARLVRPWAAILAPGEAAVTRRTTLHPLPGVRRRRSARPRGGVAGVMWRAPWSRSSISAPGVVCSWLRNWSGM